MTSGSRVAPTRHQTLRAAFTWSDELLTEEERVVFRRLAVFAGEFQLEAAESICADTEIADIVVLDIMSSLVDRSLVVTNSSEQAVWHYIGRSYVTTCRDPFESSIYVARSEEIHIQYQHDVHTTTMAFLPR